MYIDYLLFFIWLSIMYIYNMIFIQITKYTCFFSSADCKHLLFISYLLFMFKVTTTMTPIHKTISQHDAWISFANIWICPDVNWKGFHKNMMVMIGHGIIFASSQSFDHTNLRSLPAFFGSCRQWPLSLYSNSNVSEFVVPWGYSSFAPQQLKLVIQTLDLTIVWSCLEIGKTSYHIMDFHEISNMGMTSSYCLGWDCRTNGTQLLWKNPFPLP